MTMHRTLIYVAPRSKHTQEGVKRSIDLIHERGDATNYNDESDGGMEERGKEEKQSEDIYQLKTQLHHNCVQFFFLSLQSL